jgi:hypothetical protein
MEEFIPEICNNPSESYVVSISEENAKKSEIEKKVIPHVASEIWTLFFDGSKSQEGARCWVYFHRSKW